MRSKKYSMEWALNTSVQPEHAAWHAHPYPFVDCLALAGNQWFGVWERVKDSIKEGRERFANKLFLAHVEKAANRYETWIETRSPGHIAAMRQFTKQTRGQVGKAA